MLDTIVYGTDSTQSAIDELEANPAFRDADIAFAVGGGKAIDTVKTAAKRLRKTVFSVPTICSNCSSATAIAVVYNDDHSLKGYAYPDAPAHIFINPAIIAAAPKSTSGPESATRSRSSPRSSTRPAGADSPTPGHLASPWRAPARSRS